MKKWLSKKRAFALCLSLLLACGVFAPSQAIATTKCGYKVRYICKETGKALRDPELRITCVKGQVYSEQAIIIPGYYLCGPSTLNCIAESNPKDNIVTFIYSIFPQESMDEEKQDKYADYYVHYCNIPPEGITYTLSSLSAPNSELAPAKAACGEVGITITEHPIDIPGYKVYDPGIQLITPIAANPVHYYFYYEKEQLAQPVLSEPAPEYMSYHVRYVSASTGEDISPPKAKVGKINEKVVEEALSIKGYTPNERLMSMTVSSSDDNDITFQYSESDDKSSPSAFYTVFYKDSTSGKDLKDQMKVTGLIEGIYKEPAPKIDGYYVDFEVKEVAALKDGGIVTFFYSNDIGFASIGGGNDNIISQVKGVYDDSQDKSPETGDSSSLLLLAGIMGVSAVAIGAVVFITAKKKSKAK